MPIAGIDMVSACTHAEFWENIRNAQCVDSCRGVRGKGVATMRLIVDIITMNALILRTGSVSSTLYLRSLRSSGTQRRDTDSASAFAFVVVL